METWRAYGTKSTIVVPLSVGGGAAFGAVSFAVTREETNWRDDIVDGFRVLAQMFVNALSRKDPELELREQNARVDLATEAAGAGLRGMEDDFGKVWATPKTREISFESPRTRKLATTVSSEQFIPTI